ncbi:MAG: DUF4342 domain-containing protein [Oscillospiraceae bacterium]|nr:DUF4342 domain-containing protein [Oscillospiraceae bacterium]
MTNMEMVEMLREKANVSYEEAKAALERNNWDVLDAMIDLERRGKFSETKSTESYFTNNDTTGEEEDDFSQQAEPVASGKSNRKKRFSALKEEFKKLIRKGLDNSFVVRKEEKDIVRIPALLFVIMLLAAFWVMVPLMIVGAVFHYRYAFQGKDLGKEEINETMEKAADYVDGLAQKCC